MKKEALQRNLEAIKDLIEEVETKDDEVILRTQVILDDCLSRIHNELWRLSYGL